MREMDERWIIRAGQGVPNVPLSYGSVASTSSTLGPSSAQGRSAGPVMQGAAVGNGQWRGGSLSSAMVSSSQHQGASGGAVCLERGRGAAVIDLVQGGDGGTGASRKRGREESHEAARGSSRSAQQSHHALGPEQPSFGSSQFIHPSAAPQYTRAAVVGSGGTHSSDGAMKKKKLYVLDRVGGDIFRAAPQRDAAETTPSDVSAVATVADASATAVRARRASALTVCRTATVPMSSTSRTFDLVTAKQGPSATKVAAAGEAGDGASATMGARLVVDTTIGQKATRAYQPPATNTTQSAASMANRGGSGGGALIDLAMSRNPVPTTPPKQHGAYLGLSPEATIAEALRRATDVPAGVGGKTSAAGLSRSYIVPVVHSAPPMSLKPTQHRPIISTITPRTDHPSLKSNASSSSSSHLEPSRLIMDTTIRKPRTYEGITLLPTASSAAPSGHSRTSDHPQEQPQQQHNPRHHHHHPVRRSPTPPRQRATTALSQRGGSNLVFDTSSLIKIFEWGKERVLDRILSRHRIYIPNVTLDELDKMSKQQSGSSAKLSARAVFCRSVRDWITSKINESQELQRLQRSSSSSDKSADCRRIFIQRRTDVDPEYERRGLVNDDAILGYAVYLRNIRGIVDVPIVFVTEDKMLQLKASSEDFTCVGIQRLLEMEESPFVLLE